MTTTPETTRTDPDVLDLARSLGCGNRLDVELTGPADLFGVHDALRAEGLSRIRTWVEPAPTATAVPAVVLRVTAVRDC